MNLIKIKYLLLIFLGLLGDLLSAQLQQSKWYFGAQAALDFMTSPPTPLLNSAMNANIGCASQADATGNLLFYTNGVTVYNASHVVMANGTGLLGIGSPVQPCLIVQQPGSANLYYIFTVVGNGNPGGLNYSVVDMALAAGQGSVTVLNASLYAPAVAEKITGTTHCNGSDVWIVVHQNNSNNFRSYLLSAGGINTTAVVSTIGPASTYFGTYMKISPSGNKLATVNRPPPGNQPQDVVLYDFDNTMGTVSNYQSLYTGLQSGANQGIEFSPDGSKLYCSDRNVGDVRSLHQWDLCAGSLPAVIASHYSVTTAPVLASFQLAINGKIYIAGSVSQGTNAIGVINSPNSPGALCNYIPFGQTLGTQISSNSLPNFISRYKVVLPPFSYSLVPSVACHAMSFTANLPAVRCASSNYTVDSLSFNFGDPASGTLNGSNVVNPLHLYSSSGTFTTTLIFYYKCRSDTLRQTVYVPPPDLAVSSSSNCSGAASATAAVTGGIGPYSYSWLPGAQTGSAAINLSLGSYSLTVVDQGLGCTVFSLVTIAPITAAVLSLTPASLSVCVNSSAALSISGNATSVSWSPLPGLSVSGNTVLVNPTASQVYTISGVFNACIASATLLVSMVPLPTPTITVANKTLCVNSLLNMQGYGGTQYQWTGPGGFFSSQQTISTVLNTTAAAGVYTLTVTGINGCKNATTTSIAIGQLPGGALKGFKTDGCAPLCGNYYFEKSSQQAAVISAWQINGLSFGDRFTHCFTEPGIFSITGTATDTISGCARNLTYQVNVWPRPKADFVYSPQLPLAELDEVTFTNTSAGDNQTGWRWYFNGNGKAALNNASGRSVVNRFNLPGTYVAALLLSNAQGCTDTLVKTILVNDDVALWVPNTFTPNNDGLNDVFLPITRGLKTFSLLVFNRWGTKVFESQDPVHGWDGNFLGEPAQDGNYIGKINYSADRNYSGTRSGQVLLNR